MIGRSNVVFIYQCVCVCFSSSEEAANHSPSDSGSDAPKSPQKVLCM